MLKVVVCVKAVPDPQQAAKIRIDPATMTLTRGEVPLALNPLDRNAIEAAVVLKSKVGAQITALSMGPPGADAVVRESLALGADEGVLLSDPDFGGADAFATAFTLARGIEKIGAVDLVLCGMASSDGSTEWVGPMLAAFLDFPVVTMVEEIVECEGRQWKVKASLANGYRLMQVRLPAVLTVTRDLNTPRALSFSGIVKARKRSIERWGRKDLGVSAESVGLRGSPTVVAGLRITESRRNVEMIVGTRKEKAAQLIAKLADSGFV